jgi:hypothetical protein
LFKPEPLQGRKARMNNKVGENNTVAGFIGIDVSKQWLDVWIPLNQSDPG